MKKFIIICIVASILGVGMFAYAPEIKSGARVVYNKVRRVQSPISMDPLKGYKLNHTYSGVVEGKYDGDMKVDINKGALVSVSSTADGYESTELGDIINVYEYVPVEDTNLPYKYVLKE